MILARLTRAFREQNWFAVTLEFFIVIAGVVIGFQITAWNAERSDREREQRYVIELIDDVESDLAEIRQSLSFAQLRIAATNRIFQLALNEEPAWTIHDSPAFPDLEPVALPDGYDDELLMLAATAMRTIDQSGGTWDMLIATGDVAIMRAPELIASLQAYRTHLTSVMDLESFVRSYMPGIDAERRSLGIGLGQTVPVEDFVMMIETYPEFAAGLRTMRTFSMIQYEDLGELEESAMALIAQLEARRDELQ
ncbi:hypothetical protein V0U79_06050 [Hyphobacterium sp. HN65]|uniref:Uncharacterized protein n=1 Tax=Hyphobacterium lacteum TaxID=3116575 RepID=A0ABU7LPT5_9PROT|nr:hypothetical protein [Hyphobacterium sp. HN65]MEE2525921.1 hypothetical protein [Hyphobacterium sp. HN65]